MSGAAEALRRALLARAPDEPGTALARGLLLERGTELWGDAASAFVVSRERGLACGLGALVPSLAERLRGEGAELELLVREADLAAARELLPEREPRAVRVLAHPDVARLVARPPASGERPDRGEDGLAARALAPGEPLDLDGAPEELAEELAAARARGAPFAVASLGGAPVSFCYATCATERHWDVSVDTLANARRRGAATAAFLALARAQAARGLAPAWGSLADNEPSWRLAERLGFRPAASAWLLSRSVAPA